MTLFKPNWLKVVIAILVVIVAAQFFKKDEWHPVYYPNSSDLTNYVNGPVMESLEECRDWVKKEANERGQRVGEYDYECGLNCKYDDKIDISICEDTKS